MKNTIPYLLIVGLFIFSSCKKEHTQNPPPVDSKTYSVKFNVSGFTQTITDLSKTRQVNSKAVNSTSSNSTVLYYYVLDSTATVVSQLRQDSTSTNFGTISDNLPAGKYDVILIAGKGGLITLPTQTKLFAATYNGAWKDSFYKKFSLTVSDTPVDQDVTLERFVAQLQVNITDAIPATASTIAVSIQSDYEYWNWKTATVNSASNGFVLNNTTIIPATAIGQSNFKTNNIILLNTATPFTVTITSYDAAKKSLGSTIVTNVTCKKNTRTILSGNLFSPSRSLSVSLSPWDPNPVEVSF